MRIYDNFGDAPFGQSVPARICGGAFLILLRSEHDESFLVLYREDVVAVEHLGHGLGVIRVEPTAQTP